MKVFDRPYVYFTIGIFLLYLVLNLFLSGFYQTIPLILIYAKTVNWFKLLLSLFLSLIIGILVAMNAVYVYISYRERKKCKGATTAGIGAVGGLVTGICPLCVTGLFPLLFGLFGISFSLASLPFQGIEVQVLVIFILIVSLNIIRKR